MNAPQNPSAAASASTLKPVPLFDISRQHQVLEQEIADAMQKVCSSGKFILGPDCVELETATAKYCQAKHAVSCASGSDALLLALMAFDIGPGDEVICPSYTFFATASAVTRLGATPVFVDIEPESFNIDVAAIEAKLTPRTKVILPVHLYGQCVDMAPLNALAKKHGLRVIEDSCQAIGAEYRGKRTGALGDIACFSYYPTKNLGAYGDGGMLTTDDDALADKLRLLRGHGMQPRYYHQLIGINSRLDSLQAAVLNIKLPHLDTWTEARQERAQRYTEAFTQAGLTEVLDLPVVQAERRHVWNQYIVRVRGGNRDALRAYLAERKVGTEIYYPVPLHQQTCFAYLGCKLGSLPQTERAATETLALPIFPELTIDEQRTVVQQIGAYFGRTIKPTSAPSTSKTGLSGPNFLRIHDGAKSSEPR
ncbi:MAG: DegT/DnrJ/EryC1/StrS family aminotransferase [Planctomycetia bacterium]|nr:DegT/DnrJ/EryC1/StrS family aminotransferase [Planctomycetia bacterium]